MAAPSALMLTSRLLLLLGLSSYTLNVEVDDGLHGLSSSLERSHVENEGSRAQLLRDEILLSIVNEKPCREPGPDFQCDTFDDATKVSLTHF